MWIFIWFILSAILLGATLWSLQILLRQKTAWEKFAKAKNFTFTRGTFMGPAEMLGVIGDYKLKFFAAEREGGDVRSRRMLMAMEVDLGEGIFNGMMFGTKQMLPFMQAVEGLKPYKFDLPAWKEEFFAFVWNEEAVKAYMTNERLESFVALLGTKNADVIVVCNETQIIVRLETADPMVDADKIDKIVKRTTGLIDKIRVSKEERQRLNAISV